jgi:hypothetical protein
MLVRLARPALALLLGALTTIAVAWALAAWAPVSSNGPRVSGAFERWDRAWHITRIRHRGVRIHWWSNLADDEPVRSPAALLDARAPPPAADLVAESRAHLIEWQELARTLYPISIDNEPPAWGTFVQEDLPPEAPIGSDTAFGWPAPCLWYQVVAGFNRVTMSTVGDRLAGGILLSGAPESRASTFRALPLRPTWPGLALDALFYGAVWGMALFAPRVALRSLRRRRGLCVRCGYDLRDQMAPGCPECGAGRLKAESRKLKSGGRE